MLFSYPFLDKSVLKDYLENVCINSLTPGVHYKVTDT